MTIIHRRDYKLFLGVAALSIIICLTLNFTSCRNTPVQYRVGILCGLDFFASTVDGFKARMTELGYIEGKNIVYDIQKSELDNSFAEQVLKKFISEKVDLIFVLPTEVAIKAKKMTLGTSLPVLFANSNIEGVDLVHSVKEPGENITGVRYPGPDLTIKRFEIMCEIAPKAKRMLVPYKRGIAIVPGQLAVLHIAAKAAGVRLIETPADDAREIKSILKPYENSKKLDFDAILMIAEPLGVTQDAFLELARFAEKHRIPFGGALMMTEGYSSVYGVSTNNFAVGKQAAPLADKILKGISTKNIPVVSAENFLQINYDAAVKIGINIPDGLLKQADKVISTEKNIHR